MVWKWVALTTMPPAATPASARSAISRARSQAAASRPRPMEPSQAKLNWQPRLEAPWKTTPQTGLGESGAGDAVQHDLGDGGLAAGGVSPRASK